MSSAHVLIVDDDHALLQALPEALRLRLDTVTVDTCDTAPEALSRIAATDYDAIISDIKMPGMDGLALLAEIRALRPDTPTLLITGHGQHDLAVQALRGGAFDFIQKPIDREYFVASLSRAIQMRQLRRRVKELDGLKTQLFTDVSHELRTPLALVLGPTQKLLAAAGLTDEQHHDLEVIERNVRTLLKRVNDLLDIAKLDAGQMGLNSAEVDLARLVRLTAAHFEAFAQERKISFSIRTPASVAGQADREKLQRVFLNLLSNAFKFAPDGGRVGLELRLENGRALVIVQDNGPGVKPELREAIFERFRQGDSGARRGFGGTGLGLAIAQEFVALHGGTIAVDDAPEGGALFCVGLPLVAPAGAEVATAAGASHGPDIARQTLEELRERRPGQLKPDQPPRSPLPPPAGGPISEAPPPLVLVVEDNHEMNRFIAETLARDYRVATAFDGQEGLEKALALRPDLILSDVVMPRLGGDHLVREVRARPELENIPLVLLTAKVDDELRVGLLRQGAQDYLTKPFAAEELRVRARNLITMKRVREMLRTELASQSNDLAALASEVTARQRQLQSVLAALQESEERSRLLVESVKDYAIFMLDPAGRVVSWNVGAERITGYHADEIIGEHFSRFYPPDAVGGAGPEQHLTQAATAGRVETEGWRLRKDGSSFWANAILTSLADAAGHHRGFSVVTRDVTEQREAEEQIRRSLKEKEVLLTELHHRVKNNLQVICSLLNLQSLRVKDRRALELFKASQDRVKSMALIHEQLYQAGDLATIDFAEHVRRLAVNLFRSHGIAPDAIRLTLKLDPISLGVDTALPCSLILNELVTNSLKHAFPSGRAGEVRISLRAGSGGACELAVSDNGVGLPPDSDLSTAPSSGLQLVATLITQLGGAMEVQRKAGTRFTIRVPREAAEGREAPR